MIFNDMEITANIFIETNNEIENDFLNKYFNGENIDKIINENIDSTKEYKYNTFISNSKISNEKIIEFIKDMIQYHNYEINIDSDDSYIYDNYIYHTENSFITHKFVPANKTCVTGTDNLLNILFHTQEEKINLE